MTYLLDAAAFFVTLGLVLAGVYELHALISRQEPPITTFVRAAILSHPAAAHLVGIMLAAFIAWLYLHFFRVWP